MEDVNVRVQHNSFEGEYRLLLYVDMPNGKHVLKPVLEVVEKARHDVIAHDETLCLSENTMQSIFNQLWAIGLRPKDGTGNSGHVEALKHHLEDMRKLVFEGKEKK